MSYSFNVRAATLAAAVTAVSAKFDEVVSAQPVHANDRDAAVAAATALTGLCVEPGENEEVSVSVSGWLQWRAGDGAAEPHEFIGGNVSVQASIVVKSA